MAQPRRTSWIIQAAICLALIVWQIYDLIAAGASASVAMTIFNGIVLIFAVLGLLGAIYALRSKPSASS